MKIFTALLLSAALAVPARAAEVTSVETLDITRYAGQFQHVLTRIVAAAFAQ